MKPITNSQTALEFFASILMLKGIISIEMEAEILDAVTIHDLDKIVDKLAMEVSGDGEEKE